MSLQSTDSSLDAQETVRVSKLLSYLLRHGAEKVNLTMTPDGFVKIEELLSLPKCKKVSPEHLFHVVETNDKKRFELSDDRLYIRASQGHSLKTVSSEQLTIRITEPFTHPVIHGTTMKAWKSHIQTEGLKIMNRNHVHFAIGLPDDPAVKSGMRKSSEVFVYIDTEKAQKDGIVFYKSSNGVVLSEGKGGVLGPVYFEKVVDRDGKDLLNKES